MSEVGVGYSTAANFAIIGTTRERKWAKAWKALAARNKRRYERQRSIARMTDQECAWQVNEIERLERKVANRDRYIALLRERLVRAGEASRGQYAEHHQAVQVLDDVSWQLAIERVKSARLEAVLRQVEWSGGDYMDDYCPLCDQHKSKGHSPDCPIGAVLREG